MYGNQTVLQGARSYKKMENFKSFKRKINPFCYIMLFLQWMNFHHFEYMWIVNVLKFYHRSSLSILINDHIRPYITIYFILL